MRTTINRKRVIRPVVALPPSLTPPPTQDGRDDLAQDGRGLQVSHTAPCSSLRPKPPLLEAPSPQAPHLRSLLSSGTNKVPTISGLLEQQERNHQESGAAEKERLMKEAKSSSDKNPAAEFKRNTKEREVLDPITGRLVIVKDAQLSGKYSAPRDGILSVRRLGTDRLLLADYQDVHFFSPAALDPSKTSTPGPATNLPPPGQGLDSTRHTAPNPVEPTNILLQQFPPPVSMESLNALTAPLKNYALVTVIALGAIVTLPLFLKGWLSSIVRTMLIVGLGGYVYSAYTITSRKLEKEIERVDPT